MTKIVYKVYDSYGQFLQEFTSRRAAHEYLCMGKGWTIKEVIR